MASRGIKLWLLCLVSLTASIVHSQAFSLQEGDLLFCCPDTANAITSVTSGVGEMPIDHVAIVHYMDGDRNQPCVIEAVKPMVRLTPIGTFCLENPRLLVGRVNADVDIAASVNRCLTMVGKPYDDLYLPGDSAIYCSELVQLNYVTLAGDLVFDAVPMSFHDQSGQVTDYWQQFYQERGMEVPEGAPGTNPGELSRRPQVSIIDTIITHRQ